MEILKKLHNKYGADLPKLLQNAEFFIDNIIFKPLGWTLPSYCKEWLDLVSKHKRTNILAFRSSGKTEVLIIGYCIFRCFTNPKYQIAFFSESLPQSMEVLRRIKERIIENEVLRTAMPTSRDADWSKTKIELKNKARLMVLPFSERARSYHIDEVIIDESGRCQDHDVYFGAITPTVRAKRGRINLIGTFMSEIDLPHVLMKNKVYETRLYPANGKNPEGKTLWEERYPDVPIQQVKDELDNSIMFSREYLLQCLSADDALYPFSLIETAFDYTDAFIHKPRIDCVYYMALDFALSGKSGADFSAYVIMERNTKTEILRIARMERYKGLSTRAQIQRIQTLHGVFKPLGTIADEGSFGKSFIQDLHGLNIPVKGFNFQNRRTELLELFANAFHMNYAKDEHNNDFPLPFKERKFLISKDEHHAPTKKLTTEFVKELTSFAVVFKKGNSKGDVTGKVHIEAKQPHDDLTMAAAMCYYIARGGAGASFHVSRGSGFRRSALIRKTR